MEPIFGLRRPPDLSPDEPLPDDEPALVARIRAEIRTAGPITFARFMEIALYDPEGGYYTGPAPRAGRAGDFLTAPESHPIFGWTIARQVVEIDERLGRPDRFVIREHGAGSGALGAAILEGLRREAPAMTPRLRYQPVETSPARIAAVTARLESAGLGTMLDEANGDVTGVILANELLDALPTHRVAGGPDGSLQELFVGFGEGEGTGDVLAEIAGEPSTPALAARLAAEGISLAPGQRAEVCLALDGWIAAAASLERGVLLLIDYGYPAGELYDATRRPRGTLRAYTRHRVHDDPFRGVGGTDLTAHVDVTAVARASRAAGLVSLGATTQAEFLAGLDAGSLLAALHADPGASLEASLAARSALRRMLDPRVGGAFRVLAFGRGVEEAPPLRGFGFRLRR